MTDFTGRGAVAEDCILRWLEIEKGCERLGDVVPFLSRRQQRTLRAQIMEAIKRWEHSKSGIAAAKKRLGKKK